jgi:hypothetical protein
MASYIIARKRNYASGYSAILIPLGFLLTGFLSGGYHANSIALIPAIFALYLEPENFWMVLVSTILFTFTGLLHSWTYFMYVGILLVKGIKTRCKLKSILVIIIISLSLILVVDYSFNQRFDIASETISPLSLDLKFNFIQNWYNSITIWAWNSLSNPLYFYSSLSLSDPILSVIYGILAPLTLLLPENLIFRLLLNTPLQLRDYSNLKRLNFREEILIFLILFVRTLGNVTGLTPL